MNIIATDKGTAMLGSGYLYAALASEFNPSSFNVDTMTEMGYISDSAKYTRKGEKQAINSANYGLVAYVGKHYTSEFQTGVISYIADNIARFMTGFDRSTVGNKSYTFHSEKDESPEIALVFLADDEAHGKKHMLVMPRCMWIGDYELDFNNDNPIELDYHFACLNSILPNGKRGAAFEVEETVTPGNADLSALTAGTLRLSPAFSPAITEYTANAVTGATPIAAVAADNSATVAITKGDNAVTNGGNTDLANGANVFKITVTNGTTEKVYTLTINKAN